MSKPGAEGEPAATGGGSAMSPNEYRMLSCCGLQKVIDSAGSQIPMQDYYRMAVEWCFLHKKEGPVVDALRYAYLNVWVNGTEHRETATFEARIGEYLDESRTNDGQATRLDS